MSETLELEKNIAGAWYECFYDQEQAKLSCELQSLNFDNVMNEYGLLYEEDQVAGANQWN